MKSAGSPPHMRGKVWCAEFRRISEGITPAYAGKSSMIPSPRLKLWDHPRICGEKSRRFWTVKRIDGSPPHMRGKVSSSPGIRTPVRDHPRICGEKALNFIFTVRNLGSPPHMRGKVTPRARERSHARITPAYAGKRLKRSRSTVPPVAIVPLFPSVCNKPVVSDGSPAGRDAPLFLPAENAVPASPAYNLRSL